MPLYCPNCSAELAKREAECWNCGAIFGAEGAWTPTERPAGKFEKREKPQSRGAAPQKAEDLAVRLRRTASFRRRTYAVVLLVMLLALLARFLSFPLAQAYPPARGATFAQALQVLLSVSMVFHPIPGIALRAVPYLLVTALFWVQVALLVRRFGICLRDKKIIPPSALSGWSIALLLVGLLSWFIGTIVFLSPIFFHALNQKDLVWAMQIANSLLTGFLYIPAANLVGITFFVLEMVSLKRDGLFFSSVPSTTGAASSDRAA